MTTKPSRSSVARIKERTTGSSSTTRIDALAVSVVSCIGSSNGLAGRRSDGPGVNRTAETPTAIVKRIDEFSAKRRCNGRLDGPVLGRQQRVQLVGSCRHFTLKFGEKSFCGQNAVVLGQSFDLFTIL